MAFRNVEKCSSEGREKHTVVADLDGTLTRGRSSFPYFMLMAIEGGSILRAVVLMLVSPLAWMLYHFVSEEVGIRVLIFVSFAGLKVKDIEAVARAVLPKFYAEDIHPESWRVFSACCFNRCVVTANPRIMVEHFCKNHLGADKVLGTEIQVTKGGRATGFLLSPGVLVGDRKRHAVKLEFGDQEAPDVGLGDRESDHPFLHLCKEAYMVPPRGNVEAVPMHKLFKPVVFHDGRLVQRPTPAVALMTLIWFPFGLVISIIRVLICVNTPLPLVPAMYKLLGIKLTVRGNVPAAPEETGGGQVHAQGVLFVCCHRTCLDPVFLSVALGKQVTAVTYSVSRLTEIISPIPTVRLTRNREKDAGNIKRLLEAGHLVICPEGTTCREPVLLRFSALFAELTDQIVPVAVLPKMSMFHGNTVRGYKAFDPFFFLMNPRPHYEVTFLEQLPRELTHAGGKSPYEVANCIQKMLAATLGFQCTTFTRRDKYLMLTQGDGSVKQ
ncbi:hypothetical protein GOP47_0005861 [Adiantum capillus-veneris]|uniref:Phospholipid/glycerol acyltransferase domain-containing protein n=1 Tax=Adiantum capillus-veneris TaxID=13818 RepID=A0A9D4V7I5_ADICA|nr:hypothetical protein GOP47_0005861 [Adiantum capillus-veneris]